MSNHDPLEAIKKIIDEYKNDKLRPFQKETAIAAFRRFELEGRNKVIVADEVGLGKTFVALGVIELMNEKKPALNVIYMSPNATLAKQNIDKLKENLQHHLGQGKMIRLYSLSPVTTFGTASNPGTIEERALLCAALSLTAREIGDTKLLAACAAIRTILLKDNGDTRKQYRLALEKLEESGQIKFLSNLAAAYLEREPDLHKGLIELGTLCLERFAQWFDDCRGDAIRICDDRMPRYSQRYELYKKGKAKHELDSILEREGWNASKWHEFLIDSNQCNLYTVIHNFIFLYAQYAKSDQMTQAFEGAYPFARLFPGLRQMFNDVSLEYVRPDLIILDEFHKYSQQTILNLIDNRFAKHSKILLLSATPYKMGIIGALPEELDEADKVPVIENAFNSLEQLIAFVDDSEKAAKVKVSETAAKVKKLQEQIRSGLVQLAGIDSREPFVNLWHNIEASCKELKGLLSPFFLRTERYMAYDVYDDKDESKPLWTGDENDNFDYKGESVQMGAKGEMAAFLAAVDIADGSEAANLMRYSKAAPFFLSFAKDYESLLQLVRDKDRHELLFWEQGTERQRIPNLQMQQLAEKVLPEGIEELAWIPPVIGYYKPDESSVFVRCPECAEYTKSLVFTNYVMSTRAIGAVLSDLVRQKAACSEPFEWDMPYITCKDFQHGTYTFKDIVGFYKPIVDQQASLNSVIENAVGEIEGNDEMLALAAIASPAVCAYRALMACVQQGKDDNIGTDVRVSSSDRLSMLLLDQTRAAGREVDNQQPNIEQLAIEVGEAFAAYFRHEDIRRVLRAAGVTDELSLLRYCANGNMQAILDEFIHLHDPSTTTPKEMSKRIIEAIYPVSDKEASKRTQSSIKYFSRNDAAEEKNIPNTRIAACGFAERFTADAADTGRNEDQHKANLQRSFNSPFYPFVLATTPTAQEGLDFHWYSHRVLHWSLPATPTELEQREGRINRYSSHAIRKRVAERQLGQGLSGSSLWVHAFQNHSLENHPSSNQPSSAQDGRMNRAKKMGMYPYWYVEGEQKLERIVGGHPLSREEQHYRNLIETLGYYRLSMGYGVDLATLTRIKKTVDEINRSEPEPKLNLHDLILNLSPAFQQSRLIHSNP